MASSEDVHSMTWVYFLNLFHGKYLSEANLSNKVRKFMSLLQGSMSVSGYTTKFDTLARFAPSLVPTDQSRKMKYMHGLNVDIVSQVDSGDVGPRSYANAAQKTLRIAGWREGDRTPAPKPTTATPSEAAGPKQSESRRRFRSQSGWDNQPQRGDGMRSQQGLSYRPQGSSGNRSQSLNQSR